MIDGLQLIGEHRGAMRAVVRSGAILARLFAEFPTVETSLATARSVADLQAGAAAPEQTAVLIGAPTATRRVLLDAAAWRDPETELFAFDERVFAAASTGPAVLAISGAEPIASLAETGLQVLTRYQSLIDRRNPASAGTTFDAILACHASLHDLSRPLVRADFAHARDVWQWVLRLSPHAGLAVQVAALFHDVERLANEADVRIEQHAADYPAFKNAHAQAGARMTLAALDGLGLAEEVRRRIAFLVSRHERPERDPELALLNDADALSFFSLNSPGFLRYYGPEHTRKKVAYTLNRLSPAARHRLLELRLIPEIAQALEALSSPAIDATLGLP